MSESPSDAVVSAPVEATAAPEPAVVGSPSPAEDREIARCADRDLRVEPRWGAATGSIGGTWGIVNEGPECSIRLPLRAVVNDGASTVAGPDSTGRAGKVVPVPPSGRVSFVFLWSNWCRSEPERFTVDLSFDAPDVHVRVVAPGPPSCSGGESSISIGELEIQGG